MLLGRKYRIEIVKLLKLEERIDRFKPTDLANDIYREFYLSSTDKRLVNYFGGQREVSRAIDKAKKIGLLVLT